MFQKRTPPTPEQRKQRAAFSKAAFSKAAAAQLALAYLQHNPGMSTDYIPSNVRPALKGLAAAGKAQCIEGKWYLT